jgi:hypothetical protein
MQNLKVKKMTRVLLLGVILMIGFQLVFVHPWLEIVSADQPNQIPTGSIPTVTSTPMGPFIIVNSDNEQINVRAYPDPLAPKVGVLLAGQKVPAKGKSNGYIEVEYLGIPGGLAWVYANLVTVYGELPIVEPPSTPTPLYTSTIDPTLAAQFLITLAPTRLPTFTVPPPLVIPTYPAQGSGSSAAGRVPMGLIIVGIGALGIFLAFISLIRGR